MKDNSAGINSLPAVNPTAVGNSGKNPGGPGYIAAVVGPAGPQTVVKTANDSVKGVSLGNYPVKLPRQK